MIAMWDTVSAFYEEYINSGDPRVTSWLLMKSPVPTILLVVMYVAFVKVIGPALMKNRKPFDLRFSMFVYNMAVVATYSYFVKEALIELPKTKKILACRITDLNDPHEFRLAQFGWWFFFLKLVELVDTVFFVLRKKNQHISLLHVVHHSVVPLAVWFGYRAEPAGYNYFFPLINSFIHIVMYTYYGLAALGPSVQKYLRWKKYLTTLQITQFVVVFIYILVLVVGNCKVSKFIIYLNAFLAGLFLLMFLNFFRVTYIQNTLNVQGNKSQSFTSLKKKDGLSSQEIPSVFHLAGEISSCSQCLSTYAKKVT